MDILIINQCCGCLNFTQIYRTTYNNTSEFLKRKNSGIAPLESIIYPVFGDPSQKKYYGMSYVPMYYLEEGVLITLKKTSGEIVSDLLFRIAGLWPLLVIFLFMAAISGFVLWSIVSSNYLTMNPKRKHGSRHKSQSCQSQKNKFLDGVGMEDWRFCHQIKIDNNLFLGKWIALFFRRREEIRKLFVGRFIKDFWMVFGGDLLVWQL